MATHNGNPIEGRATFKATKEQIGFWTFGGEHDNSHLGRLRENYLDLVAIGDRLSAETASVHADDRLTDVGKREALANAVTKYARTIKRGRLAVEAAERGIAERKESTRPKPSDPTDIAGALRRQELRAWLRGLSADDRAAALKTPNAETVQAIVEMPAEVSGTNPAYYERMLEAAIENGNPGTQKELTELGEALETTRRALEVATGNVRQIAGIPPSQFDGWLNQNAGKDGEPRAVVGLVNGERVCYVRTTSEYTGKPAIGRRPATDEEWETGYHHQPGTDVEESFRKVGA